MNASATLVEPETETTIAPPISQEPPSGRFVHISGLDWDQYAAICSALGNRPAVRLTYDRGELEIKVTYEEHEGAKKRFARLVDMLTFVLRVPIRSRGSMTFQRKDLDKGFEPDECYWIASEPQMREREKYDPYVDPPPDLAIEIEFSRGMINRLRLYAALGIREIWRWDLKQLRVMVLNAEGTYDQSLTSKAFPFVPMDEFAKFLTPRAGESETDWIWRFHDWVKANVVRPVGVPLSGGDGNAAG